MRVARERHPGALGLALQVHRFVDDGAAPSGVTVLLLHGFLDRGLTWDDVAAPLARAGHAVVAPDLRGYGESERTARGGYYHFPDYVADVDALVRSLAPERLIVVGHSMGGTVACLFAGARPERVERLVLVEGIGPPSLPRDQARHRMRQWLDDLAAPPVSRDLASHEAAVSRLARFHPQVPHAVLERRARQLVSSSNDGLAWCYDPLHRTTSPTAFSADLLGVFLANYRGPVLYVGGGESGFHPEDEAARLAMFSDVRRVEIEGAGHMVHWTAPDALAEAILGFAPP
ncbi:MAG: alpha/beta hydrolase [Deltaproteobacteria bacterium]|nr:alpha/beta hydrolase [Deltaproteobacteria bacterium]